MNTKKALAIITACVVIVYGIALAALLHTMPSIMTTETRAVADDLTMPAYHFPVIWTDATEYATLADHIRNEHAFSLFYHGVYSPETFRTPGYPLFLAAIRATFGSWIPVIPIQILIVIVTSLLIWWIAKHFMSPSWALVPALAYALDPVTVFSSFIALSDILFVLPMVGSVACALHWTTKQKNWQILVCGFLVGIATLVRPIGMFAIIAFLLVAAFGFGQCLCAITRAVLCGLLLLGFLIPVAPWIIRNKLTTGTYGISSVSDLNFIYFSVPLYLSRTENATVEAARAGLLAQIGSPDDQLLRSLPYGPRIESVVGPIIRSHPVSYALFHLSGTPLFFFSSSLKATLLPLGFLPSQNQPYVTSFIMHGQWKQAFDIIIHQQIFVLEYLLRIAIFLLALVGFWRLWKDPVAWLMALLTAYYWFATGPLALPRYRIPAEPFLFTFAVVGLLWLIKQASARWSKTKAT